MLFSRITIRDAAAGSKAFWSVFNSAYSLHQGIWGLFGDEPGRRRDFLYHLKESGGPPVVYALSARHPEDTSGLWKIESREFDPQLSAGGHLGFLLRANPVRTREGKRHDVVMEQKRKLRAQGTPKRAWPAEAEIVQEAGTVWLRARSENAGFLLHGVRADAYRQHDFLKGPGRQKVSFSTIDFEGTLEVIDANRFREVILNGLGPAKGFGCGMLLIRRLP